MREDLAKAIMHGVQAGKLRTYVRENGETGLAGLLRLADRHSSDAMNALDGVLAEVAVAATPRNA